MPKRTGSVELVAVSLADDQEVLVVPERPEWLSSQIWDEYTGFSRAMVKTWSFEEAKRYVEFASKLVADPECAIVWAAFDKRNDAAPFGDLTTARFFTVVYGWRHLPLPKHQTASVSKRRSVGGKIAALSSKLLSELADYSEYHEHNILQPHIDGLEKIREEAIRWSNSKPLISHLSSSTANQLYFIRKATLFFRQNYGQPLWETTAALVRVIYENDIDGDQVAALARRND